MNVMDIYIYIYKKNIQDNIIDYIIFADYIFHMTSSFLNGWTLHTD